MGVLSNLRGSRTSPLPLSENGLSSSSSSSTSSSAPKKKCSNLTPFLVIVVVIAEIAFLGRLDMAKNAAMFNSIADIFYKPPADDFAIAVKSCEEWLEREDAVVYSRDFEKHPILVSGAEQVML